MALPLSVLSLLALAALFQRPASWQYRQATPQNAIGLASQDAGLGWYTVVQPAIVRKEKDLHSKKVAVLKSGSQVLVDSVEGRRAHLQAPQVGWASVATANGSPILKQGSSSVVSGLLGGPNSSSLAGGFNFSTPVAPGAAGNGVTGKGADQLQTLLGQTMTNIKAVTKDSPRPAGAGSSQQGGLPVADPTNQAADAMKIAQQLLSKEGKTVGDAMKDLNIHDKKLQAIMKQQEETMLGH